MVAYQTSSRLGWPLHRGTMGPTREEAPFTSRTLTHRIEGRENWGNGWSPGGISTGLVVGTAGLKATASEDEPSQWGEGPERRPWTRREVLGLGAGVVVAAGLPSRRSPVPAGRARTQAPSAGGGGFLNPSQRETLDAALARMIPAQGRGDWSAADVGAGDYIDRLLSAFDLDWSSGDIYAGGPYRPEFPEFQALSRVKHIGWEGEVERLRQLYVGGLAELDQRAGGGFAGAPAPVQDAILEQLDYEGSAFFAALYNHTMEGVYSHPVYGGNTGYQAWKTFCYQGDVHGVRFPTTGSKGSWNTYGGYAPEEMEQPGRCPGQGPS
jgi:gluconate 2-dehydrogenase gamma chain